MKEIFKVYNEDTESLFFMDYAETSKQATKFKIEITTKKNAVYNFFFKVVVYCGNNTCGAIDLFTEKVSFGPFDDEDCRNRVKEEKIQKILKNVKTLGF